MRERFCAILCLIRDSNSSSRGTSPCAAQLAAPARLHSASTVNALRAGAGVFILPTDLLHLPGVFLGMFRIEFHKLPERYRPSFRMRPCALKDRLRQVLEQIVVLRAQPPEGLQ